MSKLPASSLFKIIFEKKSSIRFLIGTIGSFSFSMAVILCTLGLMDGFVDSLKQSLSHSNGDIKITSREGVFSFSDDELSHNFISKKHTISSLFQIESFAIIDEVSKGILLKGVEPKSFSAVTGIDLSSLESGIYIGEKFSSKYNVSIGDYLSLVIPKRGASSADDILLEEFEVLGVVKHGIYEKDMRFLYIDKKQLTDLLGYKNNISNLSFVKKSSKNSILNTIHQFKAYLGESFVITPYWEESQVLIDAVEVEKYSISLILQLIVVVSILNIVAFIIFISEIKSQDFFMLRALGVSVQTLQKFWLFLLFLLWLVSCGVGVVLTKVFSFGIENLPFLKIPGDIYVLSELRVLIGTEAYFYVFGLSLIWILLIGFMTIYKLKKQTVISGLRQEFS